MNDTEKILEAITHLSTAVQALAKGQTEQDKKLDSLTNGLPPLPWWVFFVNDTSLYPSGAFVNGTISYL